MKNGKIKRLIDLDLGITLKVLSLVSIIIGVFLFLIQPIYEINGKIALMQKDIEVIQLNHETHMQDALIDIADLKKKDETQDLEDKNNEKTINDINTKIAEILVILKK